MLEEDGCSSAGCSVLPSRLFSQPLRLFQHLQQLGAEGSRRPLPQSLPVCPALAEAKIPGGNSMVVQRSV